MGQLVILTGCLNNYTGDNSTEVKRQQQVNFDYFDTVSYVFSYANDSAEVFKSNADKVFEILGEYNTLFDIYVPEYELEKQIVQNPNMFATWFIICAPKVLQIIKQKSLF